MIHRFVDLFREVELDRAMIWIIRRQTSGTTRRFALGVPGSNLADYLSQPTVPTGYTPDYPDLSPDLSEYIFTQVDSGAAGDNRTRIARAPSDDNTNPVLLAENPSGGAAVTGFVPNPIGWSPDGQQFFYRGCTDSTSSNSEVRVMDRDGSNNTQLWTSSTIKDFMWGLLPRISFDGTMIALWVDFDSATNRGLWVMNSDGTNMTKIYTAVTASIPDDFFGWSRDSEWLVFGDSNTASTPRTRTLYKCRPDGSDLTVLYEQYTTVTPEPIIVTSYGQYGIWLADGSGVVCAKDTSVASTTDPEYEVGILATDGSETFTALSPQRLMYSQSGLINWEHGPIMNADATRLYWQEGEALAAMNVVSAKPDGSDYRVDDDMTTDALHNDYIFTGFAKRSS